MITGLYCIGTVEQPAPENSYRTFPQLSSVHTILSSGRKEAQILQFLSAHYPNSLRNQNKYAKTNEWTKSFSNKHTLIDRARAGQPLLMFQLSPSPRLVTRNFTHYQPKTKDQSSQRQDGVRQFLVSHPILTLEKVLSTQGSAPVPKFQHISIFTHFYTLLIRRNKKSRGVASLLHRSQKSAWG